jgi:hypothetical protein
MDALNPAWRVRPQNQINPLTLAKTLECWSVDSVLAEVTAPFKPSNTALHGRTGRRTVKFSDRRRTYFPDKQIIKKNHNIWIQFAEEPGYIWKYQKCLRIMEERGEELRDCLEELLDQCQCLCKGTPLTHPKITSDEPPPLVFSSATNRSSGTTSAVLLIEHTVEALLMTANNRRKTSDIPLFLFVCLFFIMT